MDIINAWSRSFAVASYSLIILALLLSEISWLAFRTPLETDRMHHSIRGVKMTPTSRRCDKIGFPVEGLRVIQGHWKRNHWIDHTRHGRGSIFCDPTQPNPVANGPNPTHETSLQNNPTQPNPLRKIEAIITIHSAQWSIKTRPQIFVKYLCKYLSILIILGMILQ